LSVVTGILLHGIRSLTRVLPREIAHLRGLGVDDAVRVGDVGVDELAVLDVDQGREERDGGADKAEAPERGEFDEEVGD
jgi:hypothetical protein